jgi:HEPN domain-containing protein
LIVPHGARVRKIHDLTVLAAVCIELDPAFAASSVPFADLNRDYIETRYPVLVAPTFSLEDADRVVDEAERVVDAVAKAAAPAERQPNRG